MMKVKSSEEDKRDITERGVWLNKNIHIILFIP